MNKHTWQRSHGSFASVAWLVLVALVNLTACGTLEVGIERTATPGRTVPTTVTPENDLLTTQIVPTPTNPPTAQAETAANPSYQANNHSGSPVISSDGRYVVFSSGADNLVPGDTNEGSDIFVHDRQAHTTQLITWAEDGSPANASSGPQSISSDGRWVVFVSIASNLVAGDAGNQSDVFVHDRQTGRTTLVSMAPDGTSGNGMSTEASISADGRWIVFTSTADDLVPEIDEYSGENIADTNGMADIFVYDRLGESIRRVSLSSDGEQGNNNSNLPSISADGRWVVFWSLADNLVPGAGRGIYLYDRSDGITRFIADGFAPTISPGGRWIGFLSSSSDLAPGGVIYALLYDRQTDEITVIGGYAEEIHGRASNVVNFSMDGEWLAFSSVFISPDSPLEGNSSEWGQQVFLRDQETGSFTLLSAAPNGLAGNSSSASPSLSADGRWIAFQSFADNLVSDDTNGYMDVFVYDRETGAVELVSWAAEP
jgi:Tol biopolymer transport system component